MAPDLTLEVIYYNQPTDFKMEFALAGCCNTRFLSQSANDRQQFLKALGKSVIRSRAIVAVGSFNMLDSEYLPKIIANATGYTLSLLDKNRFGILSENNFSVPSGAIPLVTNNGVFGGCVLESNDQTIIMLTAQREVRHIIVDELVCQYLKLFSEKNTGVYQNATTEKSEPETQNGAENNIKENIENENSADNKELETQDYSENKNAQTENTAAFSENENLNNAPNTVCDTAVNAIDKALADIAVATGTFTAEKVTNVLKSTYPVTISDNTDNPNEKTNESEKIPVEAQENSVQENSVQEKPENQIIRQETENANTGVESLNNNANPKTQENNNSSKYIVLDQPEIHGAQKQEMSDLWYGGEAEQLQKHPRAKKHRFWRGIISVLLVLSVLAATYFSYEFVYQPLRNKENYKNVHDLYGQTWENLPENMLYKFGMLYKTNSKLIGWISIPNTSINLPVVSSKGRPDNYYETHLFEGSVSRYGTPYTLLGINEDTFLRNTVIYAKGESVNMPFYDLKTLLDKENYLKAASFSFDTVYLENKWKIFSVFTIGNSDLNDYVKTSFFDDDEFNSFTDSLKQKSIFPTFSDVTGEDELLTLVSKNGSENVLVVARKVREGESPLVSLDGDTAIETAAGVGNSSDSISSKVASDFKEISSDSEQSSSKIKTSKVYTDKNLVDGASSRYEQNAPTTSTVTVKPNKSEVTSVTASNQSKTNDISEKSGTTSSGNAPSNASDNTKPDNIIEKLPTLYATNSFNGQKVSGRANEIVAAIIEAEMGPSYNIEALKAQAVATYSWLLCNGSADKKYPSVPMKTPSEKSVSAANAVAGVVATYKGNVATTYYYAISAGHTANCEDVWTAALPYLRSVESSVDKNINGYQTIRKYSSADIAKWVKDSMGVDLTKYGAKSNWFKCTYDSNNTYVKTVTIGGVQKKGTYLRDTVFTAARVGSANTLRSSAYTVTYSESEDKFIFTVRGYGHGVGMSQSGANVYAANGWDYQKILTHYYTGITLGMYTK